MDKSRVALGRWGELRVARHYQDAGYELLSHHWQIKGGELDLVLGRGNEIVFCEVKTRSSQRFGSGWEAVGYRQQGTLRRTAMARLAAHGRRGSLRFDVAVVSQNGIEVCEGAF
jgi:putative endonuclease